MCNCFFLLTFSHRFSEGRPHLQASAPEYVSIAVPDESDRRTISLFVLFVEPVGRLQSFRYDSPTPVILDLAADNGHVEVEICARDNP